MGGPGLLLSSPMATDYDPDYDLETWVVVMVPGHHTDATRTLRGRYADAMRSANIFYILSRKYDFRDLKNTNLPGLL